MSKKIGVIGGMGPMASQLFYKMVTEHTVASKDQDHVQLIVFSDSGMPDRTGAILSGRLDEPRERLLKDAKLLESCGCEALCVTCNTAHFFVDLIKDDVDVPFIHMIDETAKRMAEKHPGGKIGIMATDGTVKTELYQKALKKYGLTPFAPRDNVQKLVMHEIYDCIKAGKRYDASAWADIENEYKEAGCDSVLLACTELSVIKADENLSDWYTDPMLILCEKVIEFAGKEFC